MEDLNEIISIQKDVIARRDKMIDNLIASNKMRTDAIETRDRMIETRDKLIEIREETNRDLMGQLSALRDELDTAELNDKYREQDIQALNELLRDTRSNLDAAMLQLLENDNIIERQNELNTRIDNLQADTKSSAEFNKVHLAGYMLTFVYGMLYGMYMNRADIEEL